MTPKQMAEVCMLAGDMHEASFDNVNGNYQSSWSDCVGNALAQLGHSQDFVCPIHLALASGYADLWDWTDEMAKKP